MHSSPKIAIQDELYNSNEQYNISFPYLSYLTVNLDQPGAEVLITVCVWLVSGHHHLLCRSWDSAGSAWVVAEARR